MKFDFDKIFNWSFDFGINLVTTILILVIGFFAVKLVLKLSRKAMEKAGIDKSLIGFFQRCIRIGCYVIILISALSELGISTTGIIASFSAAVAALALALKDSLSDIASGIVILFTRPFVTGDFIEFEEYKGFVQKIDIMNTNIRTYDDTNVIIPNSKITTSQVNNYTAKPQMRLQIFVPIPYNADFDKVKEIILDTINHTDNILVGEEYEPSVRLQSYAESSLEVIARCWVNFEDYWTVYYSLMEEIKKELDKNKISIPFNQLDVHILDK